MALQVVDLDQATNHELVFAARFAGGDEIATIAPILDQTHFTDTDRKKLRRFLLQGGYNRIQIDPGNRITIDNYNHWFDGEVAQPVK